MTKSSWQWVLMGTLTTVFNSSISLMVVFGIIIPTVSGTFRLSMPASCAALQTCFKKGISERVASIGENSHFTPCFFTYSIESTAADNTCSGVKFTAYFICTGEVGMKTWIKSTSQSIAASISPLVALDRAHISGVKLALAMSRTTFFRRQKNWENQPQ